MTIETLEATGVQEAPFYRPFGRLLKERFPFKVYKVTIDAGMTCPNIDGSVAEGGCTDCDNTSFSPAFREKDPLISRQIDAGVNFYQGRFKADHFLAYFQTFSNTYAPVERLKKIYDRALKHPQIVGRHAPGLHRPRETRADSGLRQRGPLALCLHRVRHANDARPNGRGD